MANNEEIMCINRIKSLYEKLTPRERAIADYIVANHEVVSDSSCDSLAKATGTSPASVVRFSKKIGFAGFMEMKLSLSKQWIDQNSETVDIRENDSTAIVKQKVLLFNKNVIGGMLMTLKEEELDRAVDVLCRASRILIMGDGGSGTSARNAYDVLLQLGLNCIYETDPFFQVMQIGQLGPEDAILAISNSGRSQNIYDNLRQASDLKVPRIGIVGIPNSPMSKYLDIELHTNFLESASFCDSVAVQICELSAVAVLHSMILRRKQGGANVYSGQKLGDAYDRKRIGWDK